MQCLLHYYIVEGPAYQPRYIANKLELRVTLDVRRSVGFAVAPHISQCRDPWQRAIESGARAGYESVAFQDFLDCRDQIFAERALRDIARNSRSQRRSDELWVFMQGQEYDFCP
jgi:hypothetical protein